jgi:hypothetical protein
MGAESQYSAYQAGLNGRLPIGVAAEDMAAYQSGALAAQSHGGGGGGGGGGGLLLIPFLLALPVALVVGTCLYPLPGLLTVVAGALVSDLVSFSSGLGWLLCVMLPCVGFFILGMFLERWLERWAAYRQLRHVARVLVVGFVAHALAFSFRGTGQFRADAGFFERLSVLHVAIVLAALVGGHFLSRRLDARLGGAGPFFAKFRLRRSGAAQETP